MNKVTKLQLFLIICIFLTGVALRLVHLGKIPSGLTNDEANVGYDAYSILKTGKDQWGQQQPSTYLKGFGDYRPPIYTYAVIPSVALFDLNEFSVRLPSAIAGSLTLLLVFSLSILLWRNIAIGILSMFFLAFNPWHIAMSRVGIESNFGVFIITLAFNLFFLGLAKKKWLYPAMFLFALSVFTYPSYVILTPLFVGILYFMYRKQLLADKKNSFIALLVFIIILLPLFTGGNFKTASTRSQQVNLTHDIGTINNVNDKRGECQIDFPNKVCQLFENKYAAFTETFIANYLHHFSPELLANNGTNTQYSVLPERGLLYKFEYIFFIIGLLFLLRKKQPGYLFLLLWIFITPIPDSITGSGHYSRYLPILPAIQLTSAIGAYGIWSFIAVKKRWLMTIIFPIVLYEIAAFLIVYLSYFPRFYATFSHYGYKELMQYIHSNENNYDKIIISSRVNDTKQYAFYLFYTKYDPALYLSGKNVEKVTENDSWTRVKRIGKINFLSSVTLSAHDLRKPSPHILLAGAPIEFPEKTRATYIVKDPKKNKIFLLVSVK